MIVGLEIQAHKAKGHFLKFHKCQAVTKEFLFSGSQYHVGIELCSHRSSLGLPLALVSFMVPFDTVSQYSRLR